MLVSIVIKLVFRFYNKGWGQRRIGADPNLYFFARQKHIRLACFIILLPYFYFTTQRITDRLGHR